MQQLEPYIPTFEDLVVRCEQAVEQVNARDPFMQCRSLPIEIALKCVQEILSTCCGDQELWRRFNRADANYWGDIFDDNDPSYDRTVLPDPQ